MKTEYHFLVLEDDPNRIEQFKKRFKEFEEHRSVKVYARFTDLAKDCIHYLETRSYDLVFLDHDLGGLQMVSSNDLNTGSEVARQIVSKSLKDRHGLFLVHSFNPTGAKYMCNLLKCPHVPSVWNKEVFHKVVK